MKRQHLMVLLKVAVAGGLLAWLVHSGTLDFGALGIFFDHPALLAGNLAIFIGTYLVAALRWRILLASTGVQLSLPRAIQLTLVGAFFNVVAPGNIGGDILKAIYVARDQPAEVRPRVYLIGLLDRLLAVAGLVAVAVVLNLWTRARSADSPMGQPTIAIIVLAVVTLVIPAVVLVLIRQFAKEAPAAPAANSSGVAKLFHRLMSAARLLAERPGALAMGLGLSIGIHLASIAWFTALASAVTGQHVTIGQMATVYPIGMLSVLLPVSYAGLGVGHIAFERLFAMIGLKGGANVINVHLIGQMVPCLFGVFPYLMLKREATAPSQAEITEAS